MAEDYPLDYLWSLAEKNNLLVSPDIPPQQLYELLLILNIISLHHEYRTFGSSSLSTESNPTGTVGAEGGLGMTREKSGIIGWEVHYETPSWVDDIVGTDWNPKYNPIYQRNQTWVFHSGYLCTEIINKTLSFLNRSLKWDRRVWKSLHTQLIGVFEPNQDRFKDPWRKFLGDSSSRNNQNQQREAQKKVGLVGWENHMRFVYKDGQKKQLIFFDPWRQHVDRTDFFQIMAAGLKNKYGYDSLFVNRRADQSDEDSCVIDCLSRCLMICEYGVEAASWAWEPKYFAYPILAIRSSRLVEEEYSGEC